MTKSIRNRAAKRFDYGKLRGRIAEKYRFVGPFSRAVGLSGATVSERLNGRRDWTQSEIVAACDALDIPKNEIGDYFFSTAS